MTAEDELFDILKNHSIPRLKEWISKYAKQIDSNKVLQSNVDMIFRVLGFRTLREIVTGNDDHFEFTKIFFDAKYTIPVNFMDNNMLGHIILYKTERQVCNIFATRAGTDFLRQYENFKNSAILDAISEQHLYGYSLPTLKSFLAHTRITQPHAKNPLALYNPKNHTGVTLYCDFLRDPTSTRKQHNIARKITQADLLDSALVFCLVILLERGWFATQ